jgi:hypothetical protein
MVKKMLKILLIVCAITTYANMHMAGKHDHDHTQHEHGHTHSHDHRNDELQD